MTLRARLTLWTVAIFTTILWVFGAVFWLYDSNAIRKDFIEMLDGRGQVVADRAAEELPGLTRARLREIVEEEVRSEELGYYVVDVFTAGGRHALEDSVPIVDPGSLMLTQTLAPRTGGVGTARAVPEPVWTEHAGRSEQETILRAVVVSVTGSDGQLYGVFLAASDVLLRSRLDELRVTLLILAATVPGLSILGGWFVAGIAVAPFAALQTMAEELRPGTLGNTLHLDGTSPEVAALAEELDEARQKIREAFQAQERFLSNVSHEIKTPIAVMRIEAQTLNVDDAGEPVRDFVSSVQEEMKRLGNLVESFLTLTRIEDGHGQVRGKKYAVNDLVMDSVEQCAIMANQRRVWLRPELFGDEETIDVAVGGDPELLTTMLGNLIRNAINYSPDEAGVRVVLAIEGDRVGIKVIDEGPGIPRERINSVFDRFAQASGPDRKGRGHGLGLAIAKGIAELHHGTITVRSEEGHGCEFEVTLPILAL